MRSFRRYYRSGLEGLILEGGSGGAGVAILQALRELVDVELVPAAEVVVHGGGIKVAWSALWKHAVRLAGGPLVHPRRKNRVGQLQAATWSAQQHDQMRPIGQRQPIAPMQLSCKSSREVTSKQS